MSEDASNANTLLILRRELERTDFAQTLECYSRLVVYSMLLQVSYNIRSLVLELIGFTEQRLQSEALFIMMALGTKYVMMVVVRCQAYLALALFSEKCKCIRRRL